MAEENIGQVGIFRPGIGKQLVGIRHRAEPAAVEIALNALPIDGLAVAHMILRHHQEAQTVQILGKSVIPLHKFRDAVDDLQNRLWLPFRLPAADMDPSCAAGIKSAILPHIIPPLRSRRR